MKTPTHFVKPLDSERRTTLKQLMQTHPNHRVRMRAHAVLLSDHRYSIAQIADIFEVDGDTVRAWLARCDDGETDALEDDPRLRKTCPLDDGRERRGSGAGLPRTA